MPITPVANNETFRTWFTRTNELITAFNTQTLADGLTPNGVFLVSTGNSANRLGMGSIFVVAPTAFTANVNTTFSANVTIATGARTFIVSSNTTTFQSPSGTSVLTPLAVSGVASFTNTVSISGNTGIAANTTVTGNFTVTGTTLIQSGALHVRQVLFTSQNNTVSAAIASPQVNDFTVDGLEQAQILSLNPSIHSVITGITAPTTATGGARLLYVHNTSSTYRLQFASGSDSSQVANRFVTPNNENINIEPGGTAALLWSAALNHWRIVSAVPAITTVANVQLTGTTTVTGTLNVQANSAFTGNAVFDTNVLFVNAANDRVGVKTASPATDFHVNGDARATSLTITNDATFANVTSSGTTSLAGAGLTVNATSKAATFTGIINVTSTSTSTIPTLNVATLSVTGTSALTNATLANADLTGRANADTLRARTSSVLGAASASTFSTSGLASLASLSVAGSSTLAGTTFTGAVAMQNALNVSGTFTGGAINGSSLSVSGATALAALTATTGTFSGALTQTPGQTVHHYLSGNAGTTLGNYIFTWTAPTTTTFLTAAQAGYYLIISQIVWYNNSGTTRSNVYVKNDIKYCNAGDTPALGVGTIVGSDGRRLTFNNLDALTHQTTAYVYLGTGQRVFVEANVSDNALAVLGGLAEYTSLRMMRLF